MTYEKVVVYIRWNPVCKLRTRPMKGGGMRRWASRVGGKGRHFHVAFVYRRGRVVVVVVYSKRKWRVSLRNSTKNRHIFLLFFSFSFFISRHLVILPFVSVSLIAQLFLVIREMSRFANQTAVSICCFFHLLLCFRILRRWRPAIEELCSAHQVQRGFLWGWWPHAHQRQKCFSP